MCSDPSSSESSMVFFLYRFRTSRLECSCCCCCGKSLPPPTSLLLLPLALREGVFRSLDLDLGLDFVGCRPCLRLESAPRERLLPFPSFLRPPPSRSCFRLALALILILESAPSERLLPSLPTPPSLDSLPPSSPIAGGIVVVPLPVSS